MAYSRDSNFSPPILPLRMSRDSIEEIKGFISSLLYMREIEERSSIQDCLFTVKSKNKHQSQGQGHSQKNLATDPIVKGPFIDLKLPFKTTTNESNPLIPELTPNWDSYVHQIKSYKRLFSESAKNTLITTGTGSGKSECFILPILDYVVRCKRKDKKNGVKALIIYPMNALIEDQGERFSKLAHQLNKELNLGIRVGRYTGFHGQLKHHDPKNPKLIIDHRETLCHSPPDILLTNYRMLDFMLLRGEEQNFWNHETQDVFKYLVLDELHTFDGAKGADVACLIRRLKLKMGHNTSMGGDKPQITYVGTSATVGDGSKESIRQLCDFATTLFGSQFTPEESVIQEDRYNFFEFFQQTTIGEQKSKNSQHPKEPLEHVNLLLKGSEGFEEYIRRLTSHWQAPYHPVKLGRWLLEHTWSFSLIKTIQTSGKQGVLLDDLAHTLSVPPLLLGEFLDLIAYARGSDGKLPLFPLSAQIWVQGVPYLLRKVSENPKFIRPDRKNMDFDEKEPYLPAIHCTMCGASGWISYAEQDRNSSDYILKKELSQIQSSFYQKKQAIFMFPVKKDQNNNYLIRHFSSGNELRLTVDRTEDSLPVTVIFQSEAMAKKHDSKKQAGRCSFCDNSNSMVISSFHESMLVSVLTNVFLASGSNPSSSDKKLLIFNDSVQDTAHQAGYLSAKGFRFNFRRLLLSMVDKDSEGQSLDQILRKIDHFITQLWKEVKKKGNKNNNRENKRQLINCIPKELWERWEAQKDKRYFVLEQNLQQLRERLNWETWTELTTKSGLGWSLRKTVLLALDPEKELFANWVQEVKKLMNHKGDYSQIKNIESFTYGILRRMITQGSLYHQDLDKLCYKLNNFSYWPITDKKPHLSDFFYPSSPKPISTSSKPKQEKGGKIDYFGNLHHNTWYSKWAKKHQLTKEASSHFYSELIKRLVGKEIGLLRVNSHGAKELIVLDPQHFRVYWKSTKIMNCNSCKHFEIIAIDIKKLHCTQIQCNGTLRVYNENDEEKNQYLSYMGRQYKRKPIIQIAHPHTAQLSHNDRKQVEQAFKRNLLPGDSLQESGSAPYYKNHPINVLTCTPTMELGIDIGTLSGVLLRSFPKTLSHAKQRLGRAGRTSGNAFNIVVTGLKPHDSHFWKTPSEFFNGSIIPPGCKFRNEQLLLRQFHAFCFDEFSKINSGSVLPRKFNDLNYEYQNHPFFADFFKFLDGPANKLVSPFVDSMKYGSEEDFSPQSLENFLKQKLENGVLSKAIMSELDFMRKKNNDIERDSHVKSQKKEKDAKFNLNTYETSQIIKSQIPEDDALHTTKTLNQHNQKIFKERLNSPDYLLNNLADKGYLPNYAFPEKAVYFDYNVRIAARPNEEKFENKFSFKKGSVDRPAFQALRELSPGSSYYVDGFKVPITRLETNLLKGDIKIYLVCSACGTMEHKKQKTTIETNICSNCGNEDAQIINLLNLKSTTGIEIFTRSQIKDQDDIRSTQYSKVETFINYQKSDMEHKDISKHATWVSSEARMIFEFKTHAEIFHVNRNIQGDNNSPKYFDVCKECLAIPFRGSRIENGKNQHVFKDYGINRHDISCSFRDKNETELIQIALGRWVRSDAIRIFVDKEDDIPTIHATLAFSMRTYLKGTPLHLIIEKSILSGVGESEGYRNSQGVYNKYILTLYDNVPGGTGHLRSLMKFNDQNIDSDFSGLTKLVNVFRDTLDELKKCDCKNACYNCLLNYENRYQHDLIQKKESIKWLNRFIEAKDWKKCHQTLSAEVIKNPLFDSNAEEKFFNGFKSLHLIPGLLQSKKIDGSSLKLTSKKENFLRTVILQSTKDNKVSLKGDIPYTKPDFVIKDVGKSDNIRSFIYIDGHEYHLNPSEDISVFENKDYKIRNALRIQYKKPVLTFSARIVDWWTCLGNEEVKRYFYLHNLNRDGCALIDLICQIFCNQSFNKQERDFENIWSKLMQRFCAFEISKVLGFSEDGYLEKKDYKLLKDLLENHVSQATTFGGLDFNPQTKSFHMDTSINRRLDNSSKRIRRDFRYSWELFWMLWVIDPNLVSMKCKGEL